MARWLKAPMLMPARQVREAIGGRLVDIEAMM